jgi:copper transport protein
VLVETDPLDGATLDDAPDAVTLRFNEPVGLPSDPVRLFDAAGERVDAGDATHAEDASVVQLRLGADLPDSVYTVTWQAVSADSHLVRGSFTFTVGDPGDVPVVDLDELTADDAHPVWDVAAALTRWTTYAGALLAVGMTAFLLIVHDRQQIDRDRLIRILRLGTLCGLAGTVANVPAQIVVTGGSGVAGLTELDTAAQVLGSTFGFSVLLRLIGLLGLLMVTGWLWQPGAQAGCAAAALVTVSSFLFAGHTAATEPRWLVLGANLAHTTAASIWFGGLVALAVVLQVRRRTGRDAGASARMVARFSTLAVGSVVAVAAAGTALAWAEVRSWGALVGTTYGWMLLVKAALVLTVVAFAAYNNRRLVPAIQRGHTRARAWQRLSGTVRFETVGVVAVLAVTAFLVSTVPARVDADDNHAATHGGHGHGADGHTAQPEPFGESLPLGPDHEVNLVVYPAQPGTNEVSVFIVDHSGNPVDLAREVEIRFALPEADVAPLTRVPNSYQTGTYHHSGPELAMPGTWEIEVRASVSEFELLTSTFDVPIGRAP